MPVSSLQLLIRTQFETNMLARLAIYFNYLNSSSEQVLTDSPRLPSRRDSCCHASCVREGNPNLIVQSRGISDRYVTLPFQPELSPSWPWVLAAVLPSALARRLLRGECPLRAALCVGLQLRFRNLRTYVVLFRLQAVSTVNRVCWAFWALCDVRG